MSENGEIYTAGKNFTLPPALTALTNSTSALLSSPLDLIVPTSVSLPSLILRILINNIAPIIAALFFVLEISYLENCARWNSKMNEQAQKETFPSRNVNQYLSIIY